MRARLNVLSEMPDAWKNAVLKWRALNRRFKTEVDGVLAPDPNEEYLLYQTLVGAWPFAGPDARFVDRIDAYMLKALRESKVHTSWLSPDEAYEDAVHRFVRAILDRRRALPFLEAFAPFQARVAELGIYNSLAQLLIKITAPGIPDFYQGSELWDLNLVDPDNRRPVDYDDRRRLLDGLGTASDLLAQRADGRIKMFVDTHAGARRAIPRPLRGGVPAALDGRRTQRRFSRSRARGAEPRHRLRAQLIASIRARHAKYPRPASDRRRLGRRASGTPA